MSGFIQVADVSEVPESGKLCLEVEDRYVLIVKIGEDYYCIDDVCTHDGGTLGDGELNEFCIACPRHGAEFDVRTGEAVTMPATEDTASHQIEVRGSELWVKLRDD